MLKLRHPERTRSAKLYESARNVLPGGVNSPVRAFRAVGGNPVFLQRAKGAYVFDADGNEYVDLVGSWGPAIVGHAHNCRGAAVHHFHVHIGSVTVSPNLHAVAFTLDQRTL